MNFNAANGTCNNYNTGSFNSAFSRNKKDILAMNFNMQSFNAKIDEFSAFLDEIQIPPKILCLTETWFTPEYSCTIQGYKGYHCIRGENHVRGGGVSLLILDNLPVTCAKISSISSPNIEYIHVRVIFNTRNMEKIDILGIYRPPNASTNEFFSSLEIFINNVGSSNNIILLGDINICGLNPTPALNNYLDLMSSFSLMPHIDKVTRPNPHGNDSLLDHIWTNFGLNFESGVFNETLISDHYISFTFIPLELNSEKKKILFRDHSDHNIIKMIAALVNFRNFFPILTLTLDLNSKFNLFYNEIDRIYNECCPIRTKVISCERFKKPWITTEIRSSINTKYDLFRLYKNGSIPYDIFRNYKRELKKKLKKAEKDYYTNKFENCRGDSDSTWKLTNNLLGKNNKSNNPTMINFNRRDITDHEEMCIIFNNYFVNMGTNLASAISDDGPDPLSYLGPRSVNSFNFVGTTPQEVFNIIKGFKNKKTSVHNIPIDIIKKISHVISPLLSQLFNESIETGIFPDKLKTGRVIPLYKEGSTADIKNYRPISTLLIYSKIFEKLVHKRMVSFISKYKIIKANQFGFQSNKSTSDAILEFLENINDAFNEHNYYLAIYLDFSKAFDTICHEILLKKIEHMGFRGPIYEWLKSYLTNRNQFVTIGDKSSRLLSTKMGVPQGSTLGPLLFILYINDMSNPLSNLKSIHFADDSTLHLPMKKNEDIAPRINSELEIVNSWLVSNKLYLNIDKTKYMMFSIKDKPPDLTLNIGNSRIDRTNVQKFLGVYIDDRLTFGDHINKICSKISRSIGVIRRLKSIVPRNILKQLFYSFIYSKFTYGIVCYGSAYQNQIQRLKNVVKRALKLVLNSTVLSSTLLRRENILDFDLAYKYFCTVNMFKILRLNYHQSLATKINSFQTFHPHQTRAVSSQNLTLPLYYLTKCQNSFIYRGLQFWNTIQRDLPNIPNDLNLFKRLLKRYILNQT